MPASDNNWGRSIEIDGKPKPDPANPPSVDYRAATPDLFAALQTRFKSGRAFTEQDREDTQPVVIVNEALARKILAQREPDRQAHADRQRAVDDRCRRLRRPHPRLVRAPELPDLVPAVPAGAHANDGADCADVARSDGACRGRTRAAPRRRSRAAGLRCAVDAAVASRPDDWPAIHRRASCSSLAGWRCCSRWSASTA